jgi:hypothetical protein
LTPHLANHILKRHRIRVKTNQTRKNMEKNQIIPRNRLSSLLS